MRDSRWRHGVTPRPRLLLTRLFREDHLARNSSLALVTQDEYDVSLVFQDAQTLFGRASRKDGGAVVVEGLFEQWSGVGVGRDEQQDWRMHGFRPPCEPPAGCLKSPPASFSAHRNPRRGPGRLTTRRRAQTRCSLFVAPCAPEGTSPVPIRPRPCWTAFLSILLST